MDTGYMYRCVVLTETVSVCVHGRDGGPGVRARVEHLNDVERAQAVAATHDVDVLADRGDGEL